MGRQQQDKEEEPSGHVLGPAKHQSSRLSRGDGAPFPVHAQLTHINNNLFCQVRLPPFTFQPGLAQGVQAARQRPG